MPTALWRQPNAFPPPPPDADHGWWEKGKPRAASREELERQVRSARGTAPVLVWAPESAGRSVVDRELDFLRAAVREREREAAERSAYWGAGYFFLWTLLWLVGMGGRSFGPGGAGFFWMWAGFGLIPLVLGASRVWQERRRAGGAPESWSDEIDASRFALWSGQARAPLTITCVAMLSVVFVGTLFVGRDAVAAAGLSKADFWSGEWWRLWTGPWLHLNALHFYFNLTALWFLGRGVEARWGWRWLVVTLAAALVAGSWASACWLEATSVGFSGAILGLLGLQLGVQTRSPEAMPRMLRRQAWRSVLVMGVVGALGWRILDNAAHAGGLLAGIGLGWGFAGKSGVGSGLRRPGTGVTGVAALSLAAGGLGAFVLQVLGPR